MYATAALFGLLASAQVVFANFTFVHFSPTINQCGPLSVNFTGGQLPAALPLTITIVPFFARPVSIPISTDSWNPVTQAGTAVVDFLPLTANTQFLASLDDADGNSLGMVSDVMKISPSNDSFCLPPRPSHGGRKDSNDSSSSSSSLSSSTSTSDFYDVKGTLNQCAQFNVSFKRSLISNPPTIRAFLPRAISYFVNNATRTLRGLDSTNSSSDGHTNSTVGANLSKFVRRRRKGSGKDSDGKDSSDDDNDNDDDEGRGGDTDDDSTGSNGNRGSDRDESSVQPYILNVEHGQQVVLLFNDSKGHAETSPLFTVGGDLGSPTSCFPENFNVPMSTTKTTFRTSTISNALKIIIAVTSSVVVVVIGLIMVIIIRKKRLHLFRGEVRRSMSFNFTEDISMGTGSFVDRVRSRVSRFWSSPPLMSPRAPLVSARSKSLGRMSDLDEKDDIESGRSISDKASSLNSWSIVQEFPKVPVPARPARPSKMFSLAEVERALDTQFHHSRGSSGTSLQLTPQPVVPRIITPLPRSRPNPDAPHPAVPRSPSTFSSTRFSSRSSLTPPVKSPIVRVLKSKPSDDTSSFFDTCSILSSSNFVPDSSQFGGKTSSRT